MPTIQPAHEGVAPRLPARDAGAPVEASAAAGEREAGPAVPAFDPAAAREFAQQVQEALRRLAPAAHEIVFRRDDRTSGFVIEVRDPDGSLVRQYPPEKLLNLRRRLDELSGMVIDEMT